MRLTLVQLPISSYVYLNNISVCPRSKLFLNLRFGEGESMFDSLSLPYIGITEFSLKKSSSKTLKDTLKQCTKSQLELICKSYSDESFSKKEELVEYLYSAIISTCKHFFMYENKIVYDLMLLLLSNVDTEGGLVNTELSLPEDPENEYEVAFYLFNAGIIKSLMRHGYIFHHCTNDNEFYSVPIEIIREVLSAVDEQGKTPYGKWENFQDFSSCLLSAYGVLTVSDFKKLWKIMFPEIALTEDQIIEHMSFSSVTSQDYKWYENLNAISDKFISEDEVYYIIKDRSRHALYIPNSEVLKNWYEDFLNSEDEYRLNYFDQYEIEHNNSFYIQMRQFLKKVRKDDCNEILYYLMYYIKNGFKITDVINYLNDEFKITESIDVKDAERFIQIYQNLHNSTHLWVNYGGTPTDLSSYALKENKQQNSFTIPFRKELEEIDFQQIPKVGRNEPCPCGSGKKYKHCHGR